MSLSDGEVGRWPSSPLIYEVNTLPWLHEVSARYGVAHDLAALPGAAWDEIALPGVDAAWLMGAWERSPAGRAVAMADPAHQQEWAEVLPGLEDGDVTGSAYCIRRYEPDARLGGEAGIAAAREALARRGVRLILDFVPNHVALDHPWAAEAPDLLMPGTQGDLATHPGGFHRVGERVFACGRDPYFPPWRDTLQVNAFAPGARAAAADALRRVARLCDGVRCDMAMLLLGDVFERTWGERAGLRPAGEFWVDVIRDVREAAPGFLFIAEAYWGTEPLLHSQGFDFCYDKVLYDRLRHDGATTVREHLAGALDAQARAVRFIENHDEARAAVGFPGERQQAAAVAALTLPGARLVHEGQLEGRRTRLPVFLLRAPEEASDTALRAFYDRLLPALNHPALGVGEWRLLETRGWPDNQGHLNLLAWSWERGEHRLLVVVNYSAAAAQGRVAFPWPGATAAERVLRDLLSGETYWRATAELEEQGLFVDLGPWQSHVLDASATSP